MTVATTFHPASGPGFSLSPHRSEADERPGGDALRDILNKRDDRLIEDAGLTREEILGPERSFWSQWLKIKQPWQL